MRDRREYAALAVGAAADEIERERDEEQCADAVDEEPREVPQRRGERVDDRRWHAVDVGDAGVDVMVEAVTTNRAAATARPPGAEPADD